MLGGKRCVVCTIHTALPPGDLLGRLFVPACNLSPQVECHMIALWSVLIC